MRTLGIYLGSFNPFHVGHLTVIEDAQKEMDEVIIGQGRKTGKPAPDVPMSVEAAGFDRRLYGCRFYQYDGLASEFLKSFRFEDDEIYLIRGYRNAQDLDECHGLLFWIQQGFPEAKGRFFQARENLKYVSSSVIREIYKYDPQLAAKFLR